MTKSAMGSAALPGAASSLPTASGVFPPFHRDLPRRGDGRFSRRGAALRGRRGHQGPAQVPRSGAVPEATHPAASRRRPGAAPARQPWGDPTLRQGSAAAHAARARVHAPPGRPTGPVGCGRSAIIAPEQPPFVRHFAPSAATRGETTQRTAGEHRRVFPLGRTRREREEIRLGLPAFGHNWSAAMACTNVRRIVLCLAPGRRVGRPLGQGGAWAGRPGPAAIR